MVRSESTGRSQRRIWVSENIENVVVIVDDNAVIDSDDDDDDLPLSLKAWHIYRYYPNK